MKYEKMVREIVEAIGGKENILNVYHCATRLRFQLKQEDTIQDETVKNIEGVLSVVKGGGQYQIVIGRHVGDVYQELLSIYDMQKEESGLKDAKEFKEEMKDKKISSRFIRGNRWERKYSQCISLCNKASISVEAGGHNSRRNGKKHRRRAFRRKRRGSVSDCDWTSCG